MADESFGKTGSGSASKPPADPTADIDDDWALDDPEQAVPSPADLPVKLTPASSTPASSTPAEAAVSGPPTDEIDSEWPEDDEPSELSLKHPKVPTAANIPVEAASPAATPPASPPSDSVAPASGAEGRFSENSIERFEAAASALAEKRSAIGAASEPPSPDSQQAHAVAQAEPESGRSETRAAPGSKPGESLAPSQSESRPPTRSGRKLSPALAIGLAAAAVIAAGIGLATSRGDSGDAQLSRAEDALEADPANGKVPPESAKERAPEPKPASSAPPAAAASEKAVEEAAASASDAGESMSIKVNIFPDDAQIYHKGKLLGRSGTEIELPAGERMLLVLIRDGYWPRKLILDGTETVLNIGLREQPPSTFLPSEKASEAKPGASVPTPAESSRPSTEKATSKSAASAAAPAKPAPASSTP